MLTGLITSLFSSKCFLIIIESAIIYFNVINREVEQTKPLIPLFQDSPGVLKELLPALQKCLDVKRKLKKRFFRGDSLHSNMEFNS